MCSLARYGCPKRGVVSDIQAHSAETRDRDPTVKSSQNTKAGDGWCVIIAEWGVVRVGDHRLIRNQTGGHGLVRCDRSRDLYDAVMRWQTVGPQAHVKFICPIVKNKAKQKEI